jgi:DNA-binding transcriptional ArsR family regulator
MDDTRPIFAALADPVRRSLLENLAEHSPRTASQLAQGYQPMTRQNLLKHLNVLRDAGLVTVYPVGREKRYRLTPESLGEVDQWIKDLNARWDARLLRLKSFVEEQKRD